MPRLAAVLAMLLPAAIFAAGEGPAYRDAKGVGEALRAAAARAPGRLDVSELARDASGAPIWLARAGSTRTTDPAILIVGGLDGRHLVGTEMVLRLADEATSGTVEAGDWLESTTLFLVPSVNPSAAGSFFAKPRDEQRGLAASLDTDRDGRRGEDMRDDIDGDGFIAAIRYEDPAGTMVSDGEGGALLREAKRGEGERGRWKLAPEGRDDDGDKDLNEEADAGTNLARNFPVNYEWHARNSGEGPVSTTETRALIDFIIDNPRIAALVVFGPEDNLLTSPPADKTSRLRSAIPREGRNPFDDDDDEGPGKPVEHPHAEDVPIIRRLGELYRKDLGLSKEVGVPGSSDAWKGSLGAWTYYARGRLVLATPAWTPAMQLALLGDPDKEAEKRLKKFEDVKQDQRFLDWLQKTSPDSFRPWKRVEHPLRPGGVAEVGGFAPFAKINPPEPVLADLGTSHTMFVKRLVGHLPHVRQSRGAPGGRGAAAARGGGLRALGARPQHGHPAGRIGPGRRIDPRPRDAA